MRRRELLVAGGRLSIALALGAFAPAAWAGRDPGEMIRALALAIEGSSVAPPGDGVSDDALVRAIASRLGGARDPVLALRRVLQREYADGEVLMLDGWMLARTEVDLLHLHALLRPAAPGDGEPVAAATPGGDVRILAWGPTLGCRHLAFNRQSDGHSAFWISFEGDVGRPVVLVDDEEVPTTVGAGLVTTRIEGELFARIAGRPGERVVALLDRSTDRRFDVGRFLVLDTPEAGTLPPVINWGPRQTPVLTPFNLQPGGASALWFQVSCLPLDAEVLFGGRPLPTQVGPELTTATLESLRLLEEPGPVQVQIRDPGTGALLEVGVFEITGR